MHASSVTRRRFLRCAVLVVGGSLLAACQSAGTGTATAVHLNLDVRLGATRLHRRDRHAVGPSDRRRAVHPGARGARAQPGAGTPDHLRGAVRPRGARFPRRTAGRRHTPRASLQTSPLSSRSWISALLTPAACRSLKPDRSGRLTMIGTRCSWRPPCERSPSPRPERSCFARDLPSAV